MPPRAGLRVRLLLDDNNNRRARCHARGADAHPNIEVRPFNPFPVPPPAPHRLSHRLPASSTSACTQVVHRRQPPRSSAAATLATNTSVRRRKWSSSTSDVLALGPVVRECRTTSTLLGQRLVLIPPTGCCRRPIGVDRRARRRGRAHRERSGGRGLRAALRRVALRRRADRWRAGLEWAVTRSSATIPPRGSAGSAQRPAAGELAQIIGASGPHVELVSAYFVPTAAGVDAFAALAKARRERYGC